MPEPKPAGTRGRPRKKGTKVKLINLFQECAGEFMSMTICLYGKKQDIRYYDTVLLWGQGFYQKLRFVLVEYGNAKSILVSTDLTVSPLSNIHLYSCRTRIENSFLTLKQDMGGFAYHFWTKVKTRPSEANIMYILQRHLFAFLEKHVSDEIPSLIRNLQTDIYDIEIKKSA